VEVFADFVAVGFGYFVEVEGLLEFCNVATRKNIKKKHNKKNVLLLTIDTWSIGLCAKHDHKKKPQEPQTFFLHNSPSNRY
jgi:hypothetical protein